MAIAVVGTATSGKATATAPTGVSAGNLLTVVAIGGSSITVPTGWTAAANVHMSVYGGYTLYMVVATAPWASGLSLSFTGAGFNTCAAYSGVNLTAPFQVNSNVSGGNGPSTISTPTVSDAVGGGWRIAAWGAADPAGGYLSRWSTFSPADTIRGSAYDSTNGAYALALTDSNGAISTGSTSVTGTIPDSYDISNTAAIAWIGILAPAFASGFFFL